MQPIPMIIKQIYIYGLRTQLIFWFLCCCCCCCYTTTYRHGISDDIRLHAPRKLVLTCIHYEVIWVDQPMELKAVLRVTCCAFRTESRSCQRNLHNTWPLTGYQIDPYWGWHKGDWLSNHGNSIDVNHSFVLLRGYVTSNFMLVIKGWCSSLSRSGKAAIVLILVHFCEDLFRMNIQKHHERPWSAGVSTTLLREHASSRTLKAGTPHASSLCSSLKVLGCLR